MDGQEHITRAGDRSYLPAGTLFGLTVRAELSAVEVLSPPRQDCWRLPAPHEGVCDANQRVHALPRPAWLLVRRRPVDRCGARPTGGHGARRAHRAVAHGGRCTHGGEGPGTARRRLAPRRGPPVHEVLACLGVGVLQLALQDGPHTGALLQARGQHGPVMIDHGRLPIILAVLVAAGPIDQL
jgi:hypothetical protein